jgi:hypothetical protein
LLYWSAVWSIKVSSRLIFICTFSNKYVYDNRQTDRQTDRHIDRQTQTRISGAVRVPGSNSHPFALTPSCPPPLARSNVRLLGATLFFLALPLWPTPTTWTTKKHRRGGGREGGRERGAGTVRVC